MSIDEIKKKAKLSMDEMIDNQLDGSPEVRRNGHPEKNKIEQKNIHTGLHTKEKYNCKVTFNMPERLLDAFNEIYARRIIEKRKTDKSILFCEAMELFIKSEKNKSDRN